MNPFSIALAHNLIWSFFNIISKRVSDHLNARDALGLNLYFIPLGIVGASVAYFFNSAPLTHSTIPYVLFVALFAVTGLVENYLGFSLYKILDTSSFFKFQLGMGIFLNVVLDYVAFHFVPSYTMLFAGALFVLSGYLLDRSKGVSKFTRKGLFWMLIMVCMATLNGFTMKQFALHSSNDFVNLFILQIVTQIIIGGYGFRGVAKIAGIPEVSSLKWWYAGIIFLGVILEFFMFKNLSLFVIAALANVRFMIYLGYDHWSGSVRLNQKMFLGIAVGMIGSVVMALAL